MEKSRTIGEKVSTRFENLDTYLKGREKERKNVKEMQKDFEERRDRVLERQQNVFEQGEQGLANKKLFAGTRREIEDAYRDSVKTNPERQAAADEYKRMMCCEFWKTRSEQFRDVDRFRNIARTAMQKTKKEEIHINNEMRYVVGDIKSYGYRDSRHNKMLS